MGLQYYINTSISITIVTPVLKEGISNTLSLDYYYHFYK